MVGPSRILVRSRRLFTILAALALLLFVAVVVAWLWSNLAHPHSIGIAAGWRTIYEDSGPIVGIYAHDWGDGEDEIWPFDLSFSPPFVGSTPINSHRPIGPLGFQFIAWRPTPVDWYYAVGFPFWFLALASAFTSYRLRPRRRRHIGLCPACGYDLRATPEKCPECGAAARGGAPAEVGNHSASPASNRVASIVPPADRP
jgi:hypothetical protein